MTKSPLSYSSRIALVTALSLMTALPALADRTLRGKLRVSPAALHTATDSIRERNTLSFDTVRSVPAGNIRLTGYDKPLTSRKESLFVTNNLSAEITGLEIRIVYTDMSGRMLHEAVRFIRSIIPAGETRRVEFPSWDRQLSFYYHRGRKPRTANVSPYDIRCEVLSYVTPREESAQPKQTEIQ